MGSFKSSVRNKATASSVYALKSSLMTPLSILLNLSVTNSVHQSFRYELPLPKLILLPSSACIESTAQSSSQDNSLVQEDEEEVFSRFRRPHMTILFYHFKYI